MSKISIKDNVVLFNDSLLFQKQLLLLPSANLTSGVQQVEESHPTVLT